MCVFLHWLLVFRSILTFAEIFFWKNSHRGALGGVYFLPPAIFEIFKIHFLGSRPLKMSSYKKVMKTKNLPLNEIYLEYGLRFKLWPHIGALEPKNVFLAFFPICWISSCQSGFPGLKGVIFWEMKIKIHQNLSLRTSLGAQNSKSHSYMHIWPLIWWGQILPPLPLPRNPNAASTRVKWQLRPKN